MPRLLLAAALVLTSTTALAQSTARGEPSPFPFGFATMPQGAGQAPTQRRAEIQTELQGWAFAGEGYELTADPQARYKVALIRSAPWRSPGAPATLLHREAAGPWRGLKVVLRAELRTGMLDGSATLVLRALDATGAVLVSAPAQPLGGTTTFRWLRTELLIPEGAEQLVVGVEVRGAGGVYVRGLHLDDAELVASL